jgi:hypothetical protein
VGLCWARCSSQSRLGAAGEEKRGTRVSLAWLALGWTAHVAWDVGLHLDRPQVIVPAWYPLLCVGFDLVVAGFVLGSSLSGRAANSKAA